MKSWTQYVKLIQERPEDFCGDGFPIITDPEIIADFERKTGKTIGVIYQSQWHYWLVDLVQNPATGSLFTYERMLYTEPRGAVAILPFYKGKIVLVREYRHALQAWQWGIPRGFGEAGISPEANALKELQEETGAQTVTSLTHLGTLVADSGQAGNEISVFSANVDGLFSLDKGEPTEIIDRIAPFSESEITHLISRGEFTDGITMSALAMYHASCIAGKPNSSPVPQAP